MDTQKLIVLGIAAVGFVAAAVIFRDDLAKIERKGLTLAGVATLLIAGAHLLDKAQVLETDWRQLSS